MTHSWSFFLSIGTVLVTAALALWTNPEEGPTSDSGEALFLTPLIRQKRFQEAKEKCRVEKVAGMDFESYSGFLTARGPPDNANLFFWFFPAVENRANAPIFVSLGGGPGVSTLQDLFIEHGPYIAFPNGTITQRTNHWLTHFSIVYLDAPVGTGYSFASSTAAYCRNMSACAKDLLEAVQQFFTLFSEYATNDFYILGHSAGGKLAVALAEALHAIQSNVSVGSRNLFNLNGIICVGSPLIFDSHFFGMTNSLHTNGLLTAKQYDVLEQMEQQFVNAIARGDVNKSNAFMQDFFAKPSTTPFHHHIFLFTGFGSSLSLSQSVHPLSMSYYENFITRADVRRAIHMGTRHYHNSLNKDVTLNSDDLIVSIIPVLENLLDHGYRVLLMYGTNDLLVVPLAAQRLVGGLQWKGAAQFRATDRVIWKLEGDPEVAGYVTTSQNLWFVVMRNAGHIVFNYQLQTSLVMLTHFTANNSTF